MMNSKQFFPFFILGILTMTARAQTPNLQAVTDQGSFTNKSIVIWNKDGLNVGVDASTNYSTSSHYLKPSPTEPRTLRFDCNSSSTTGGWEFYNSSLSRTVLFIKQSTGFVGIGTADPKAMLAVNGDIYAKKVRVTPDDWPDFVFEPSYKLPSLQELESFIAEHKHLPEIPSAKEVSQQGLDLGLNQAKLLQKIEEMTLHLIAEDKQMMEQEQRMKAQDSIFAEQDMRLKALEKRSNHK